MSEIIIKINENNEIYLEEKGYLKSSKFISADDFFNVFSESIKNEYSTPLLPKNCIYYKYANGDQVFIIEKEAHRRDVLYAGTRFKDVGFPKLVFGLVLRDRTVTRTTVAAVVDLFIHEDSPVYRYPFSNVYSNCACCWGTCRLPLIEKPYQLSGLPELFLTQEDNDDLYSYANASGLVYREFLEKLQGRDFISDYLRPFGTFKDFMRATEQ